MARLVNCIGLALPDWGTVRTVGVSGRKRRSLQRRKRNVGPFGGWFWAKDRGWLPGMVTPPNRCSRGSQVSAQRCPSHVTDPGSGFEGDPTTGFWTPDLSRNTRVLVGIRNFKTERRVFFNNWYICGQDLAPSLLPSLPP